MKKDYTTPSVEIHLLEVEDVITISGSNQLVNGGANGVGQKASYNELFY